MKDSVMHVNSVIGSMEFTKESFTDELPGQERFDAVLGLRPELIEISKTPVEGGREATVYSVMPAGSETTVYLKVGEEKILAKQNGLQQYDTDEKVWIHMDAKKTNVFAKETGRLVKMAITEK